MKLRSESEDPLHALTSTARDDPPRRAKLRRDREDPNTEKSITDIGRANDTLNTQRVTPSERSLALITRTQHLNELVH